MNKHMSDKEMVNDMICNINSSLNQYATMITQTSNQQLRQQLQQMRNSDEQFQFQLSQMAQQKGYCHPSASANTQEIQQIRSQLRV